MCAMIPMFRTRSSPTSAFVVTAMSRSPPVVGEGLVRLRHPVDVVLLLEGAALLVEGVEDLARELVAHALLAPIAREADEPADGERLRAALRHLDRNLVVRAPDAAAAYLEHGRDRLDRLLEHLDRRPARLRADAVERVVDDLLRHGLLPLEHHLVDHLRHERRAVDGVGPGDARLDLRTPRHYEPLFAPYLE